MASAQVADIQAGELPVETRSVKALQLQQLKRSFDLFAGNYGSKPDVDTARSGISSALVQLWCLFYVDAEACSRLLQPRSQVEVQSKLFCSISAVLLATSFVICLLTNVFAQIRDEYEMVKNMPPPEQPAAKRAAVANGAAPSLGGATELTAAPEDTAAGRSSTARMLDNIAAERPGYADIILTYSLACNVTLRIHSKTSCNKGPFTSTQHLTSFRKCISLDVMA